jgi:hypothetical protein
MVAVSPKVNATFIWPLWHINPSLIPSLTSSIKRASALGSPSSRLCLPACCRAVCSVRAVPAACTAGSSTTSLTKALPCRRLTQPRVNRPETALLCIACSLVADVCSHVALCPRSLFAVDPSLEATDNRISDSHDPLSAAAVPFPHASTCQIALSKSTLSILARVRRRPCSALSCLRSTSYNHRDPAPRDDLLSEPVLPRTLLLRALLLSYLHRTKVEECHIFNLSPKNYG